MFLLASRIWLYLQLLPAIAPGLIVQLPAGKPLNTTLPVATAQVGWVIVPTSGASWCCRLCIDDNIG